MSKPLLSICIPTYNRAGFLPDCLDSIAVQFENKEVRDQMEVVISDNASSDNTAEVVKKYTDKYPNIRYFRNAANVGFDKNLLNVVEKSVGEYCLPIGDDDAFLPNSFSVLLQKIKTLQLPYYLINGWGYDHELAHPVMPYPSRNIKKDQIYNSLADFVKSIKNYTDLTGNFGSMSQIFNRKIWMDFKEKEKYVDTQLIHLFVLLTIFKDSRFGIIAEPIIKTRNDNMRWDICPGFETQKKRYLVNIKNAMWISDMYHLSIPYYKLKIHFLSRAYWISFKEYLKKTLHKLGFEKIIDLYRKMR